MFWDESFFRRHHRCFLAEVCMMTSLVVWTRERLRRRTICRMMPEGEAETLSLHRGGSVFKFVSPFLSNCRLARGAHHVRFLRPRLGQVVEFVSEV